MEEDGRERSLADLVRLTSKLFKLTGNDVNRDREVREHDTESCPGPRICVTEGHSG